MARNGFDPVDPPPKTGQPVHDYMQPPAGLGMIAVANFMIGAMAALTVAQIWRDGQALAPALAVSVAAFVAFFCAAGAGLLRRRGWGWWMTATLYYAAFFHLPVNLVLWTVRHEPFNLKTNLVVFGLAVLVLAYLMRREVLRFIHFRTPDAKPTRATLLSPAIVGLSAATISLIVSLLRK